MAGLSYDIPARTIAKVMLVAVGVALALYVLYVIRHVVLLVLVSGFLAVALTPAVNFVNRGRVPRWVAILLVYLGIVASIVGLGLLVVPPVVNGVNDLIDNLPSYVEDLRNNDTVRRYDEKYQIVETLQKEAEKLPKRAGDAAGALGDVTVGVFTRAVELLTVLVLTFILLLDGRRFVEFFFRQFSPGTETRARRVTHEIQNAVSGYVTGNVLISVIAGLVTFVTLTVLDVPFALPLSVMMAFFDLIPLVGATLGGALIAIVCAIVDFPTSLIVWGVVFIVYQQVENHLIQPVVYGRTVQLHPFYVIVSILIGATLLGVLGALLAIPAGAMVQVVVKDWWAHRGPSPESSALATGPAP